MHFSVWIIINPVYSNKYYLQCSTFIPLNMFHFNELKSFEIFSGEPHSTQKLYNLVLGILGLLKTQLNFHDLIFMNFHPVYKLISFLTILYHHFFLLRVEIWYSRTVFLANIFHVTSYWLRLNRWVLKILFGMKCSKSINLAN